MRIKPMLPAVALTAGLPSGDAFAARPTTRLGPLEALLAAGQGDVAAPDARLRRDLSGGRAVRKFAP